MSEPVTLSVAELGASAGFLLDTRFAFAEPEPPPAEPLHEPDDPLALSYAEGFAAGAAAARAEAAEEARIKAEARDALSLSFTRLDRDMIEQLEWRLRETVIALCESALAPLALDEASLLPRIKRAADMLARADDGRVIRLNPDDAALVSPQLQRDWRVKQDASLPRGAIRADGENCGVEDSPAQWSRIIREALSQC